MTPPPLHGLYALTPSLPQAQLLKAAEAALAGGARILQYRDKDGMRDEADRVRCRETALALRRLTRAQDALLIINDSVELALSVDADGAHLGGDDGDLADARRALGPNRMLGVSCYADFDRARAAVKAGADYVAFGAVYPSPTKPQAVRADLALFAHCRAELGVPTCAIGGITVGNAAAVVAAGADMLAVITDLFSAPDIAARARAFQSLFAGDSL